MGKRIRHLWVVLCLGLLWPFSAAHGAPLIEFDAKPETLAQYAGQGKWLVVMMWASDCLICNKEVGEYDRFHEQHREKDSTVLGISMDGRGNRAGAEAFIKQHGLHFPNLLAEPEEVATLFYDLTGEHWAGTPSFLIYSPAGRLMVQQIGAVPVSLIEKFIRQQGRPTP